MATKKFVVRDGFTFGARSEYPAGTILELDESAGVAFADKLRPVTRSEKGEEADNKDEVKDKEKPTSFPYLTEKQRITLIGAGYIDQGKADAAKDEDLAALGGIGESAVKLIRENKGK